ncbi:MAG TPA: hypothetical protein VN692_03320 [Steroidobacteraceae bacterium]|nr:hypothetical protein [Steroidobacteraceae bacterium]
MNISSRVFGVAIALATISSIPVFSDEAGVARDKMIRALYRGVQDMGNGAKAEAYKVEFERGTMMWRAGNSRAAGSAWWPPSACPGPDNPCRLTRSDLPLGHFFDYMRKYPRSHPSAEFIR